MKRAIVVGSGFSGSIFSRKLAECGFKVNLVEIRNHIAGNMYDYKNDYDILVHKYGPHLLNTNSIRVVNFIEKYTEIIPFFVRLLSFSNNKYYNLPFNLSTIIELLGYEKAYLIFKILREEFKNKVNISVFELLNSKNSSIRELGNLLYEKFYVTYTKKMWGTDPTSLDKSVLDRVKLRLNHEINYLNTDFQFIPKYGYTKLFENILNHENISLTLNEDALKHISFNDEKNRVLYKESHVDILVYTGAIDELFLNCFGKLPYRSLHFEHETRKEKSILPCDILSVPDLKYPFTRITEYTKINGQGENKNGYSTIVKEFPLEYNKAKGNLAYYPILNKENINLFNKYKEKAKKYENLLLCGRLADYKYYNMDNIIDHSLDIWEELKKKLKIGD